MHARPHSQGSWLDRVIRRSEIDRRFDRTMRRPQSDYVSPQEMQNLCQQTASSLHHERSLRVRGARRTDRSVRSRGQASFGADRPSPPLPPKRRGIDFRPRRALSKSGNAVSSEMNLLPLDTSEILELAAGWLGKKENHQWLDFGSGGQPVTAALLKILAQQPTHFLRVYTSGRDDTLIGIVGLNVLGSGGRQVFPQQRLWDARCVEIHDCRIPGAGPVFGQYVGGRGQPLAEDHRTRRLPFHRQAAAMSLHRRPAARSPAVRPPRERARGARGRAVAPDRKIVSGGRLKRNARDCAYSSRNTKRPQAMRGKREPLTRGRGEGTDRS